ncbi:hypothetical protein ACEPAI_4651 [Sanghuangporus weigelae]
MEFWPSLSSSAIVKKYQSKSDKRKGKGKAKSNSEGSWTSYPVIDHGALSAATLVKIGDALEWRTVHSPRKGYLKTQGMPSKVFPCTRPKEIKNTNLTLQRRAEHGAKFLRRFHPDVDIPLELIEDALEQDEAVEKQYETFDPFAGNTLSATYCFDGAKKRAIALAFPSGKLGCDLNISPLSIHLNSVLFQPRTRPVWTFDTPIRQITSSAPSITFEEKSGRTLAVRTYGQVAVFDIRNQITSSADSTKPPFAISEAMSIRSQDLQNHSKGGIVDMGFSRSDPRELFVVTEKGAGYHCSYREGEKTIKRIFEDPLEGGGSFWRIIGDRNAYSGTVASEKLIQKFDTRSFGTSLNLLEYIGDRNVITSLCPTQLEHLLCASTTSQVIWIDERYPKQPLLGWRHHRAFDRTLSLQTIEFDNTSLAFLCSSKNNHVTAISVGKLQDTLLQCEMPPRALPSLSDSPLTTGRVLIRHPGSPSDSFSLLELSEQGSLHHQGFRYNTDTSIVAPGREYVKDRFDFRWSDGVRDLERQEKDLKPDYGNLEEREGARLDLSGLYEALFGEEAQEARAKKEEATAEEVYELLENMPTYWQRSDTGEEHMRTLFDIAFGSGEEPQHPSRADFLTGTVLNSARGYRARKQGRLPISEIAKKSGWHADIQPILHGISPVVFHDSEGSGSSGPDRANEEWIGLEPYKVQRDEEIPEADRRETEAREEIALDLTLAAHVFSAVPIRDPTLPEVAQDLPSGAEESQEDTSFLTQETEKLTLSRSSGKVKEPPHVKFGFLRPVYKNDGMKKRKNPRGSEEEEEEVSGSQGADNGKGKERAQAQAEEEQEENAGGGGDTPKMPLGVRLLLSEWTVGEDPYKYEYVDPYDLDAAGESQVSKSQARSRARSQRRGGRGQRAPEDSPESEEEMNGGAGFAARAGQRQAPPTIVAARTLKDKEREAQTRPPAILPQRSAAHMHGGTQVSDEAALGSSQPKKPQTTMMANTQIEPGKFGGRQTALKKPAKKRMGGF